MFYTDVKLGCVNNLKQKATMKTARAGIRRVSTGGEIEPAISG